MDTTNNSSTDIFLIWYEEGLYSQRRFLVKGAENAKKIVDQLNQEWGCKNPSDLNDEDDEDEFNTSEYWNYEYISFENPYVK